MPDTKEHTMIDNEYMSKGSDHRNFNQKQFKKNKYSKPLVNAPQNKALHLNSQNGVRANTNSSKEINMYSKRYLDSITKAKLDDEISTISTNSELVSATRFKKPVLNTRPVASN